MMKQWSDLNSDIARLGRLAGLITLTVLMAGGAQRTQALDIGKDIERGLGKMVGAEIEATYGVVDDPLLTGWVDRLGQKLASVSGRTDVKYVFKVLDSDDVNATAAPGGFIYVNRGTLRFVQSEDELAAVMGHEVGHVAGKHAMKQLNAQLIGTLLMVGFQSMHAETLRTVGGLAGGLAMLKFTRDEENDADRRGLKNATASGYNGKSMLTFFQRLGATEKDKPNKFEVYFLTHPPTEERLRRIGNEPGTADTAANAAALGDGLAARSLYREAAEAYRKAAQLDPSNTDFKTRLADVGMRIPRMRPGPVLSADARQMKLQQLAMLGDELKSARDGVAGDQGKLTEEQKNTEREMELAARSLTQASQMISRHDILQYRQFLRMARSFDQATRIGGNLRASREMAESALTDLSSLQQAMQAAVEKGDSNAAGQVDSLVMVSHAALQNLTDGLHKARSQSGDAHGGSRSLRIAADALVNSYRMPLGLTTGQFDILDLQVTTAQDSLKDAVISTRRSLVQIAQARMDTQLRRINFLTRAVPADDAATSGIIAHYLGVEPDEVRSTRARMEYGDATLALAEQQIEKARAAKKKGDKPAAEVTTASDEKPSRGKKQEVIGLQAENASVLFNLIVKDLERETKQVPATE
jgi:tetratricopeptide (TPR) repeat protein